MGRTWTASQEAAMSLRGKTLLVSAAAGSGKTSVLTERIIRRLTDREDPADLSRILVVTFTRAAAAELKGRIASALSEALAENPGDRHLSRQLLSLGSAQISTIDSFFQKTVRAHFEELGLPATFRIADPAEILPLCMEILDGLLEEFYLRYAQSEATGSALSRIESNPFAEAMDHLLSNRSDGKLNLLLLDFAEHFAAFPEGFAVLKKSAAELRAAAGCEFLKTRYGKILIHDLKERFSCDLAELERLEAAIEVDPDIAAKCAGLLSSDRLYCHAVLEALDSGSYEKLRNAAFSFLPGRFPTIKDKPACVLAYQNFRTSFRKEISAKVQGKLEWSPELLPQQLEKTAALCEMLYAFYSEFGARLTAEKHTRGILEHNDIRAMLYRLLSDPSGSATDFARSLSAQYDAVYIDEYQDVDLLQDRIFALIGEDRRFMVGDIKQSIYGFRGSDPSIFANYRKKMPLHDSPEAATSNGICVFMSENFRCDRPVIEFANAVCSFLFSACEESVGYRPQDDLVCAKQPPEGPEPASVQVAVFDAPEKGEEASESDNAEAVWTAAEISHLLREGKKDDGTPVQPSDIAILVRAKSQGAAFAEELERLGIPVAADAASDFLHAPLLTDVLNLLRAVDNPYRDLPLSEFCISELGGFSLEELGRIREAAPDCKSLFEAFFEASKEETPIGEKAQVLLIWLEKLRDQAALLSADRFLRLLYLDARLAAHANDPLLLFLYEQARLCQRSAWCGLYGFLKQFEKLLDGKKISANGFCKAESAVTIMTVHHSKGLEFPVVFLAACGAPFNRADTRESLLFHKNIGCASKLYNRESGERENTILCELAKAEIDAEQTEESIRTLYVALTRARERLYVTGTLRGTWEKALAAVASLRPGNRSGILSANSYLSWILAVWQYSSTQKLEFPCTFRHILQEEVVCGIPLASNAAVESNTDPAPESALTAHFASVLQKSADFAYPLAQLQGLPTKAAASKLRPNLLDLLSEEENGEEALESQIDLMRAAVPSFDALLSDLSKPSATDIGTATHAFLEFCNFEALAHDGVEPEIARLVAEKFLLPDTAAIIHKKQIEAFRESRLMQKLLSAKQVYREQKFSLFLPFSTLTEDKIRAQALEGQKLFVQGSIDLLIEEHDGTLALIDYKTDRITQEELSDPSRLRVRMLRDHGTQLACYARAVKELFGRAPDKSLIYSLPLGDTVEIPIEIF